MEWPKKFIIHTDLANMEWPKKLIIHTDLTNMEYPWLKKFIIHTDYNSLKHLKGQKKAEQKACYVVLIHMGISIYHPLQTR